MTKEEVMERVERLLTSYAVKIECIDGIIKVYANTYFGYALVLTLDDKIANFDGVKYVLEEGGK